MSNIEFWFTMNPAIKDVSLSSLSFFLYMIPVRFKTWYLSLHQTYIWSLPYHHHDDNHQFPWSTKTPTSQPRPEIPTCRPGAKGTRPATRRRVVLVPLTRCTLSSLRGPAVASGWWSDIPTQALSLQKKTKKKRSDYSLLNASELNCISLFNHVLRGSLWQLPEIVCLLSSLL